MKLRIHEQAEYFALAYFAGKPACMPALQFGEWPLFISTVKQYHDVISNTRNIKLSDECKPDGSLDSF